METTAAIALALLVISEVLPYTPLKGNGILQQLILFLRKAFPYKPRA